MLAKIGPMPLILRLLPVSLVAALGGCLDAGYTCTAGAPDTCSGETCVDSSCAFPDNTCPSGYRWDQTSGDRSGQCAIFPDMPIDTLCGNGVLDTGETCDDSAGVPCMTLASCENHPCTTVSLIGTPCHETSCAYQFNVDDGTACGDPDAGLGTCHASACCLGCWDGNSCQNGEATTACGALGANCAMCGGGECLSSFCSMTLTCQQSAVPDFTRCPVSDGTCLGGACCTGCFVPAGDGGTCQMGSANTACGTGGNACADCTKIATTCGATDGGVRCLGCTPDCAGKTCGNDGCGGSCGTCQLNQACVNNQCGCAGNAENTDPLCSDGVDNDCNGKKDCVDPSCNLRRCSGNSGLYCSNGACASGCLIAGLFYAANALNPANPCQSCQPATNPIAWSNVTGGTSCMAGAGHCCGGTCCTSGCCSFNQCRSTSAFHCGSNGNTCVSCDDNNDCTVDSCVSGVCAAPTPVTNGTSCYGSASCPSQSTCQVLGCNECAPKGTCTNGVCGGAMTNTCCSFGNICQSGGGVARCVSD
jgi:hypothetical protein